MLPSFGFKARATVWCACFLFISLLFGCARSEPPRVLSPWSEQMAAMEQAIQKIDNNFVLVSGTISPVRSKQGTPDEPIELRATFTFVNPKSSQTNDNGEPRYPTRFVKYIDHRLSTTLRVDDEFQTGQAPDPKAREASRLIRLSPQDVLRLTLAEGQRYLKEPVNHGNIMINLVPPLELPSDVKAPAVWKVQYGGNGNISIWVDAATGAILKREIQDK